jgi:diguanylate cyclase (GGDEF)-like protein/PAS domain S-box-containing protein
MLAGALAPAAAIESVRVPIDARAIDLTGAVDRYSGQGDRLQVSTAPSADGIVRRIEVSARETGTQPAWIVFALTNDTNEQFDRLIVATHFRLQGSGVIWPDLGSSRIAAITASQGFPPDREDSPSADVFRLTLDPGATVTYVAELRTPDLPQIYLWEPDAYRDKVANLTLYKGIVIGVAGLLALFLTIVFVVKGAVIFPAAAALAWAVLAYVCIDFGFWNILFGVEGEADRVWRAGAEAILAATLLVFLFAYLNLNRWHVRASHVAAVWLAFLVALVALAVYDAPVAAGVARISLAAIAGAGFALVLYLALHGVERAVMLIPTWFLLLLWLTAAAFTVMGTLTHDLVSPALIGGLVLIVMLIGFTVMQNAFAGAGLSHGGVSDGERRALALVGSGDVVFDWDVSSDRIYVSPEIEQSLGLKRGTLEGPAASWLEALHPFDRDRYRTCLDTVLEQRRGRIGIDFRLRASDGHYLWYFLKARPVVGADGEVIRVVGTLADVTESRTAEERMLHDSVRDNLTGLPNREIFFDRLEVALELARVDREERPTVIAIDIDRFRRVNDMVGMPGGDSVLLTIARRLMRLLQTQDTLARISSDEFAMIVRSERDAQAIIAVAEAVRKTLITPITFNDREVSITASIGIALFDSNLHQRAKDMLNDALVATAHAKKAGGNRAEFFRAGMRTQHSDRLSLQADLRRALDREEISLLFQPIVRLEDRTIAGFEALLRWDHPRFGRLSPSDFVPIAEETDLVMDLTLFALERTARELAAWQRALDVHPPIFASVDVASRRLLRHDLLHDVKGVITRSGVLRGTLRIEIGERLIMENPEYSVQILDRIRELGAGVCLDEFGSGYTSFAYLQRMPCDMIKIDRSFARPEGGGRPQILRSLIALAHDIGMEVVAEGAETESDTIELFQLGCEFAQGNAFGNPLSAADARRLVGALPEHEEARAS